VAASIDEDSAQGGDGGAGDDRIAGGPGVETLLGGDGNDSIDGNGGNDTADLGAGDDTFVWDPGDGSDTIEGQDGNDTMVFNGAAAEQVSVSASGERLTFFRTPGNITMDTHGVENIDFNALGGADAVTYVHRSFTKGRLKCPKTEASRRAVPLQTIALEAIEAQAPGGQGGLVFPAERGGYLDLHNFRNREWKPAQVATRIEPVRRIYDLRHTFATFALRAVISTFDLSRYMGASLTMIDRHYGHLARDGREHAIKLLDALNAPGARPVDAGGRPVDSQERAPSEWATQRGDSRLNSKAL